VCDNASDTPFYTFIFLGGFKLANSIYITFLKFYIYKWGLALPIRKKNNKKRKLTSALRSYIKKLHNRIYVLNIAFLNVKLPLLYSLIASKQNETKCNVTKEDSSCHVRNHPEEMKANNPTT
jgi:hypothetical protein